jgi:glycogen debranching enzyme
MEWIEGAGDSNGDGFVDYARGAASGLANQGWKDSVDSVFHADGRLAHGPIALLEVQGYVYAARLAMAELAAHRGDATLERRWRDAAERLRAAVEARFWMPQAQFYAIAIDGDGELCRVRTSNAGHLLYTGLPTAERAHRVAEQLLSASFDNGWGVRTVCDRAARFNPMSYHNGSVWPHDTGLCAAGIARYGDRAGIRHVIDEIFGAAHHFGMRMPELFCGFARAAGEPPVGYPVACLPQAWSSGAIFMMLQAALGLSIDAWHGEVLIDRPELPSEIDRLVLPGLVVCGQTLELRFQRVGDKVTVSLGGGVPDKVRVTVRI